MAGTQGEGHGTTGGGESTDITIKDSLYARMQEAFNYAGPQTVTAARYDELIKKYNSVAGGNPDNPQYPGTSPTGTSSSGGGTAPMTAKQKANLRNSFLNVLYNMFGNKAEITKNLLNLVDQGVQQEWNSDSFMVHLRATKEYKTFFPGIGSRPGMTEAEYNGEYQAFYDLAKHNKLNLGRDQFGALVKQGVAYEEWQVRMTFMDRAERSKQYFQQLEEVAKARGFIKPNEKFNMHDLYQLMTHRGSPGLERLMEESNISYQLESAGLTVGQKGDISRKQVISLMNRFEVNGTEAEMSINTDFAQLAQNIKTILPEAQLRGLGLTPRDMFTLEYGGPGQDDIAKQVQNLVATIDAEKLPKVNPQLVEDATGSRLLTGVPKRPTGL